MLQPFPTCDTYTFPKYRFGQTSSTGVSSSVQESKRSSSSLMSARFCSCCSLPDILTGLSALLLLLLLRLPFTLLSLLPDPE